MKGILIVTALLLILLLSACAPGSQRFQAESKPANFWWGIWHGWIAPVSLIWQLFDHQIRVYEPNNTGFFYDLGFYLAIVGGFGGLAFSRKASGS